MDRDNATKPMEIISKLFRILRSPALLTPLSGVRAVSMIILHASGFPLQSDSNLIPLKKKWQHQKYFHKMLTAKLHYSTFRLITSSLTVWFRAWTKANEKKNNNNNNNNNNQYLYFNDVNLCCFCLGEFCHNHPGRLSKKKVILTYCSLAFLVHATYPCNPQPWSEHILENKSLALFLHFHHCYLPQVYTIFKRCYFLGIFFWPHWMLN